MVPVGLHWPHQFMAPRTSSLMAPRTSTCVLYFFWELAVDELLVSMSQVVALPRGVDGTSRYGIAQGASFSTLTLAQLLADQRGLVHVGHSSRRRDTATLLGAGGWTLGAPHVTPQRARGRPSACRPLRRPHPPCVVCGAARKRAAGNCFKCPCDSMDARYCSAACQRAHWPSHKNGCSSRHRPARSG